ncbi:HD-GYP domain-containing protein [Maridesulfovibrio bastinii]|uniref:HD-GYP domain-containing protein n=1 Tax=Maridesulfovibrio bastinii TaxID=47157 RepID=UPI000429AFA4|nr:HD domain-containing phosphohydrolase [Maridesulfovibrio bastinii]
MSTSNCPDDSVQEQFYPVSTSIFRVLPKSRPPFSFYLYDRSLGNFKPVSEPGKVIISAEKERILKACESGLIYLHSKDLKACEPYLSSHLRIVLEDLSEFLSVVDLAPIILASMRALIAPLFRESVKLNFERFNEVVPPLVRILYDSPEILIHISGMLDRDHSLTNKSLATGFTGLGLCLLGRDTKTELQTLEHCAYALFLCDIGLCRLPDFVLGKEFSLTIDEQKRIKHHPVLSLEILSWTKEIPKPALVGILEHHERLDGSGYPRGIQGECISWIGRLCGVVDSFVAMVMNRPGKAPVSEVEALKTLYKESSMYDPNIVYSLEKVVLRD